MHEQTNDVLSCHLDILKTPTGFGVDQVPGIDERNAGSGTLSKYKTGRQSYGMGPFACCHLTERQ